MKDQQASGGYRVTPIGVVRSPLVDRQDAPRQGDEGAPDAWLELTPDVAQGLAGLSTGAEIVILTWLHQADRATLQVHPRGNRALPLTGVFATRSPDRPNPIGLHRATVLAVDGTRLHVDRMEAIDGTPIIDIKPVLGRIDER
jgi:tRNA-Thr(GGU) m(6)t(6)A37 methyltransferase TsaA